jgi:AraC-like DNA-binding protein
MRPFVLQASRAFRVPLGLSKDSPHPVTPSGGGVIAYGYLEPQPLAFSETMFVAAIMTSAGIGDSVWLHAFVTRGQILADVTSVRRREDFVSLLEMVPDDASPAAILIVRSVLVEFVGRLASSREVDVARIGTCIYPLTYLRDLPLLKAQFMYAIDAVWPMFHIRSGLSESGEKMVSRAMAQIREGFGDSRITLRAISRRLGVSYWYLSRAIKDATGFRFREILSRHRMAAAQELLISSPKSIKEIAFAVGYERAGDFDRHFRQLYRQTPQDFRMKYSRAMHRDR